MKFSQLHTHLPKRSLLIAAAVLTCLSFFTSWFFQSKPSVEQQQHLLQAYIQKQQKDAKELLADTALLRRLVLHKETLEEFKRVEEKEYGVFLFAETISENSDPLFWNNQKMIPPKADFLLTDGIYFKLLANGYYVLQKNKIQLSGMSNNIIGYILIPVLHKYFLETAESQTQFAHSEDALKKINISDPLTEFPIRSIEGSTLFHVTKATYADNQHAEPVTLALRLFALLLLLIYLHLFIETVNKKRGAVVAVTLLAISLIACRVVLYFFPELFSLRRLTLFDPAIYASNSINRSLGDLLISALFLCWIILYAWTTLLPIRKLPLFLKGRGIIMAGAAGIFLLIFATFQLANIVYDLVTNSKISFDVTNFFGLDVYTAFGFFVLALLSLTYYYLSRLLFRFILLAFPNLLHLYFAVAVVGLLYLTFQTGHLIVLFHLPVLVWLILYTLLLSQEQLIINRLRITFAGILFWIFVFSTSLAVLVLQGNAEKEWRERRAMAEKYNQLSDPSKEQTLRVALAFLNNDFLKENFPRFYKETENRLLRDSFINVNRLGYANSYSTNFYVFDSRNQPVNNENDRSYEELNNILQVQGKPTEFPDVFYYETSYDQFIYITKRDIYDSTRQIGSLFILATPKHFQKANDLSPNLFRQSREDRLPYSYGIYQDKKLSIHSSKYSFATSLEASQIPADEITKKIDGDYDELWYNASTQKIVVVAKKTDSLIESITLFSYLFCAFIFMVGVLRLATLVVNIVRDRRSVRLFSQANIRTQIHGTIIFISVLSFLVIGAATISFFIVRYNRTNIDRLSNTATGTIKELEQRVGEEGLLKNNVIDFSDSSAQALHAVVRDIADAHGVIVNLYDLSGTLRVTSDDFIYSKGVLSNKMHPNAFYYLNSLHAVEQVQEETATQLEYLSIYRAIRNENRDTYAYLNIPSFTSQLELNQEISNFIVTIINLNAFILLIAGVIALFITNRITRTFSIIGNKMKAITLGRTNEEITWTRNDEIGELVKQYNKMVHQLEQSAEALAKSEREGAWREMARQVAHEIKNPLTPMKLSIQYLQNAIRKNQPNVQELTSNVAGTLIEQIDHLSKIAADFSQFANIGNKKLERIDLHSVLGSLVDLYSSNPKMKLKWNRLDEPLLMRTDKTHMNRLFTNLLSNAVDACSERRECLVAINERKAGDYVIISVADNGEGIPAEMQSKIFTPNFTTKTSGTGLGLAMCKSIAEQAGGTIWFETKEGEGTTFFVQLPLASS